jgi:tRNA (Thr-GGU) A37 N-methylase
MEKHNAATIFGWPEKVGIFASGSPHRPNHQRISIVRLVKIGREGQHVFLDLAKIDLLNQTPVVNIKPYRLESKSSEMQLADLPINCIWITWSTPLGWPPTEMAKIYVSVG